MMWAFYLERLAITLAAYMVAPAILIWILNRLNVPTTKKKIKITVIICSVISYLSFSFYNAYMYDKPNTSVAVFIWPFVIYRLLLKQYIDNPFTKSGPKENADEAISPEERKLPLTDKIRERKAEIKNFAIFALVAILIVGAIAGTGFVIKTQSDKKQQTAAIKTTEKIIEQMSYVDSCVIAVNSILDLDF